MRLSIVIPVLDESSGIDEQLEHLAAQPCIFECIVVDGGSRDDTVERARRHCGVEVITSTRGRAHQLNAGAARASGDTLLFLHADTRLPPGAAATVDSILETSGVVAGGFRTWHVAHRWRGSAKALLLHLADIRSRWSSLLYGDQAIFMRADVFARVGGFPPVDLMEDVAISRNLARLGRIVVARRSVRVSGRRFESAPLYQTILVNIFPALYAAGVPPAILARMYGNPR